MKLFHKLVASFVFFIFGTAANAGPILLIEDQSGFGGAAGVLTSNGFTVTVVNNEHASGYANLLNPSFLASFDFIVYGERGNGFGAILPSSVATSLNNYVLGGGDLLVTGYDTLGSPTDSNLAGLLRLTSPGDRVSFDSSWVVANVDNPIINGPFGDFRGTTFNATGYDDDNLALGIGTLALVTFSSDGQERLTFHALGGGPVGYWNGGLPGTTSNAQPDFSGGGNPQSIFLNWAAFATTAEVPEPATIMLMGLGLAGLSIARRRRKLNT
jgi:hypothetical protein